MPLFSKYRLALHQVSEALDKPKSIQLARLYELSPAKVGNIETSHSPSVALLEYLEQQAIVKESNIREFYDHLNVLKMYDAALALKAHYTDLPDYNVQPPQQQTPQAALARSFQQQVSLGASPPYQPLRSFPYEQPPSIPLYETSHSCPNDSQSQTAQLHSPLQQPTNPTQMNMPVQAPLPLPTTSSPSSNVPPQVMHQVMPQVMPSGYNPQPQVPQNAAFCDSHVVAPRKGEKMPSGQTRLGDAHICHMSTLIGREWKQIGTTCLGLTRVNIEHCEEDNKKLSYRIEDMFHTWKKKQRQHGTVEQLIIDLEQDHDAVPPEVFEYLESIKAT